MPSPYNPITLRFIRRPDEAQLDDTISIQKLGENNVRVTYTERSEDGELVDTTLMTYQRLIHYMYRVLWMLSLDEDPFRSVQFTIPGYPVTLIAVPNIRIQMASIMELLTSALLHWPLAGAPRTHLPL